MELRELVVSTFSIKRVLLVAALTVGNLVATDATPAPSVQGSKSDAALTQQLKDEYAAMLKQTRDQFTQVNWDTTIDKITINSRASFPLLYDMVNELSQQMGIAMPVLYVYKGTALSKKMSYYLGGTMTGNAWAMQTSVTDKGTITIGEDLITDPVCGLQYRELKAIVAHELAHIKHVHCPKRLSFARWSLAALLPVVVTYYAYSHKLYNYLDIANTQLWKSNLHHANQSFSYSNAASINTYGAINLAMWSVLTATLAPFQHKCSREQEKEADATSIAVNKDPMALASALEKIIKMARRHHNLSNSISNKIDTFFSSHPTLMDREKYCEQAAAQLNLVPAV